MYLHPGSPIAEKPYFRIGLPGQGPHQQQSQSATLVAGGRVHADAVVVNDDMARRRVSECRDLHPAVCHPLVRRGWESMAQRIADQLRDDQPQRSGGVQWNAAGVPGDVDGDSAGISRLSRPVVRKAG